MVNRFRSTERTGRSVGIMIMEGSRATEDGMDRTSTERLQQQQIQTLVPRLARHRRMAQRSAARSERMGVQYAAATLGTRHQFPDMG